ncbi:MAG TPA: twin-arginine translocation signal domain-containing protein [Xanthomonadales bacterium]|nr:twin-arginine translocation signal domain-containing protein [Xanthomonadales bacterium]
MAIAERVLRAPQQEGSRIEGGMSVNTGVVAAYYEARVMLRIATPEDLIAQQEMKPPITEVEVMGANKHNFVVKEGPDVRGLLKGLRMRRDQGSLQAEEKAKVEQVLKVLEENSTRSYWTLGDRAEVAGFKTQRTILEAVDIAKGYGNLLNNTPAYGDAEEKLASICELRLSDDPDFYNVAFKDKVEQPREPSRALVWLRNRRGDPYDGEPDEPMVEPETPKADGSKKGPQHAIVTEVIMDDPEKGTRKSVKIKPVKRIKPIRVKTNSDRMSRRRFLGLSATGIAVAGITALAPGLVNRSTGTETSTEQTLAVKPTPDTTAVIAPEPTVPTTVEEPVTTTTTTEPPEVQQTPDTTEAPKPKEAIGISWLSDTMGPWKEKIAKESVNYGLDPALPAIIMQIKTAGDFTINNNGVQGLFLLTDGVIKDASEALGISNPIAIDSSTNIKMGVWFIAKNFRESGGSIRNTVLGFEGQNGQELAELVEGMWNERSQENSPTFEKWKNELGGDRVINNARTTLEGYGML